MNEAVWYVIGNTVNILWGALIALYFVLSVLALVLGGRPDWWTAPSLRKGDDRRYR